MQWDVNRKGENRKEVKKEMLGLMLLVGMPLEMQEILLVKSEGRQGSRRSYQMKHT